MIGKTEIASAPLENHLPRKMDFHDWFIYIHHDENKNKEGSAAVAEASKSAAARPTCLPGVLKTNCLS